MQDEHSGSCVHWTCRSWSPTMHSADSESLGGRATSVPSRPAPVGGCQELRTHLWGRSFSSSPGPHLYKPEDSDPSWNLAELPRSHSPVSTHDHSILWPTALQQSCSDKIIWAKKVNFQGDPNNIKLAFIPSPLRNTSEQKRQMQDRNTNSIFAKWERPEIWSHKIIGNAIPVMKIQLEEGKRGSLSSRAQKINCTKNYKISGRWEALLQM